MFEAYNMEGKQRALIECEVELQRVYEVNSVNAELLRKEQKYATALKLAADALIDNHLRHDADCAINHPYYPPRGFARRPCSCGLDASLAAYRATSKTGAEQ